MVKEFSAAITPVLCHMILQNITFSDLELNFFFL